MTKQVDFAQKQTCTGRSRQTRQEAILLMENWEKVANMATSQSGKKRRFISSSEITTSQANKMETDTAQVRGKQQLQTGRSDACAAGFEAA